MRKKRLQQGVAMGSAILLLELLFLMPRVATSAVAICAADAAGYCLMLALLRRCGGKMALAAGLAAPLFACVIQCMDGFNVPVEMAENIALLSAAYVLREKSAWERILLPVFAAVGAHLLGAFLVHIGVKEMPAGMALRMAAQLMLHPLISLATATGLNALFVQNSSR